MSTEITEIDCTDVSTESTSISIPQETLAILKEAFELAKASETQFQIAQLQAEAKISKWQFLLVNTMREMDVPKCFQVDFSTGTFIPLPAESAGSTTVQ